MEVKNSVAQAGDCYPEDTIFWALLMQEVARGLLFSPILRKRSTWMLLVS
jgi:hypothetical protein